MSNKGKLERRVRLMERQFKVGWVDRMGDRARMVEETEELAQERGK